MKRFLLFAALLFSLSAFQAQPLATTQYRYWFDQDMQSGSTGIVGSGSLLLDVSALGDGIHTLHLCLDTGGVDYLYHHLFYKVDLATPATAYTYWFDNKRDSLHRDSTVTGHVAIGLDELDKGFHTLTLQTGSPTATQLVSYLFFNGGSQSAATSRQYRYWFDHNEAVSSTGTVGSGSLLLDVSALGDGFHTLNMIVDTGSDLSVSSYLFYKSLYADSAMQYAYWFDNDTSQTTSVLGSGSLLLDVSALGDGFHTLNMKYGDAYGTHLGSYIFYKSLYADSAMQYAYWFDNDTLQTTGVLGSGSLLLDVSALGDGFHTLNMKYGDAYGTHLGSYIFYKVPSDSTLADMSCTYWFDEDYDSRQTDTVGNGILSFDASQMSCGPHTLYMQIGDGKSARLLTYDFQSAIHKYATVVSADTLQGTVTGSGSYECNSSFVIRAIPAPCYHFSHWSDGSTQANRYATIEDDTTFTAYFAYNDPYVGHVTLAACEEYSWHGLTLDTSGVYAFDTVSYQGCDSTATLHLTVRHGTHYTNTVTTCNYYSWHSVTYDTSGVYTYNYNNSYGCASTDTLHLTVNYTTLGSTTVSACDSYTWHDITYTNGGTKKYNYTNDYGCASCDTLHLTINHSDSFDTVATVCDSATWHDTVYYNSTVATYHTTNTKGCDSTETLQLTVLYSQHNITSYSLCDSMEWHQVVYDTTGVYTYDYISPNGCPSTDTLNLTVFYSTYSALHDTACDNYQWTPTNGTPQNYSISGTYISEYTNSAGCPGADTLHLVVNYNSEGDTTAVVCDSMSWNGNTYSSSGMKYATFTNAAGCDSTAILHLTVNSSDNVLVRDTIVEGTTLPFAGQQLATTGSYVHTFANLDGCDSTVTLMLLVLDSLVYVPDTVFHPQVAVYIDTVVRSEGQLYNKISVESANEQMGVIIGADGYYHDGQVINAHAFALPGYVFERWRDGSRDNPRHIVMSASARDSIYLADFSLSKQQGAEPRSHDNGDRPPKSPAKDYPVPCGNNYITVRDSDSYNVYGQRFITTHVFDTLVVCFDTLEADASILFSNFMVLSSNQSRGYVAGGDGRYLAGMTAGIAGIAYKGYVFAYWGDQEVQNPRYIPMNEYTRTKIYMAHFDVVAGIDAIEQAGLHIYADRGGIVVEGPTGSRVAVYDMLGRRIVSTDIRDSKLYIQSSQFPASGVYLVHIEGIGNRKVVVVK